MLPVPAENRASEGPAEAGDHHGLVDRRTDVGHPEFQGFGVRAGTGVPVDFRRVGNHPDIDKGRDEVVILGAGCENLRQTGHRPAREELGPVRRVAGLGAEPERRAGGQCDHGRQPGATAVHDMDRVIATGDPDVNVAAEDDLLARQLLEIFVQLMVSLLGRELLALPV